MSELHARRIAYLIARIKAGQGNQAVLIEEVTKAHNEGRNANRMRRASDYRIQGWHVVNCADGSTETVDDEELESAADIYEVLTR